MSRQGARTCRWQGKLTQNIRQKLTNRKVSFVALVKPHPQKQGQFDSLHNETFPFFFMPEGYGENCLPSVKFITAQGE